MKEEKHEQLVSALCDFDNLCAYKANCDNVKVGLVPRMLGRTLVGLGNLFYGEKPSYGKFKSIEVIARIPYQSWEVVSYMLLTTFYANEERAIALSKTSHFGRASQDNETMHVVVMAQLAKKYGQSGFLLHTIVPLIFSFFYFIASTILYLISPRSALELNYLFEDHAFHQYDRFLKENEEHLRKERVSIAFLHFYGRNVKTEYELFQSIRNDELAHRNRSAERACEL
jgi:ubiquinol oxidase